MALASIVLAAGGPDPGVATHFNPPFEHPLNAWAVHGAWKDRIGADSEATELDRERFGEADQSPFRRAVWAAVRVPEPACGRRHVDDDAGRGFLQVRDA